MPQLVITRGTTFRKEWVFTDVEILTIGRAAINDLVLPDARRQVSRFHAVIVRAPGTEERYFIRDLGSHHATKVGGAVVYQQLLREGDVIELADYALLYSQEAREDAGGDELIVVVPPPPHAPGAYQTGDGGEPSTVPRTHQALLQEIPLAPDRREVLEDLLSRAEAIPELGSLLAALMDPLLHVMRATRGFIGLFRAGSPGTYEGMGLRGFDPKQGERIEISDPTFLECLLRQQDVQDHTTLLVPLLRHEEVVGFICLDRRPPADPYTPDDSKFLRLLGKLATTRTRAGTTGRKRAPRTGAVDEVLAWPRLLVGHRKSPTMGPVYRQIEEAASTDVTVLLLGETGTGKGVMAQAIHTRSPRHRGPFINVDLPNIPRELAESELLGHRRGAFTHATEDKKGRFERAHTGTIFLDEIGSLSRELQEKLLKPLGEKQITRLGEQRAMPVDVRVIAATDKNLEQAVPDGTFSPALYRRLNAFKIELPPLRAHREDIPLLAYYFLDTYAKQYGKRTRAISHTAMQALLNTVRHKFC